MKTPGRVPLLQLCVTEVTYFLERRGNFLIIVVIQNLKSAEELEEEDREAQSAKLQELIRRGTPRDLAAAQELMKSLSGANPESKPDYRQQALTELNKFESKVILLNEMLDNVDATRGEKFVAGDVYDVRFGKFGHSSE